MSQYKKHGIILCLVILIVLLCSVPLFLKKDEKEEPMKQENHVIAYLLKDDYLVEYPYISYASTMEEKIMEIAHTMMQDEFGFTPLMLENTIIEKVEIKDRIANIHFSILDYVLSKERKLLESLIYSCTQFNEINAISLFLKGEVLNMMPKGGLLLENTTRSFGINAIDTNQLYLHEGNSALIYYTKKINEKTFYVPRSIRVLKKDDYDEIFKCLLQNGNQYLDAPLLKKHVISTKSPYYEDGILHLYVNRNILEGKEIHETCKNVILKTFEAFKSIKMIQIHIKDKVYDVNIIK